MADDITQSLTQMSLATADAATAGAAGGGGDDQQDGMSISTRSDDTAQDEPGLQQDTMEMIQVFGWLVSFQILSAAFNEEKSNPVLRLWMERWDKKVKRTPSGGSSTPVKQWGKYGREEFARYQEWVSCMEKDDRVGAQRILKAQMKENIKNTASLAFK